MTATLTIDLRECGGIRRLWRDAQGVESTIQADVHSRGCA
jgi:hypothetical protein